MPKIAVVGSLALAIIVAASAGIAGHASDVLGDFTLGIVMFIVLLLCYPALRWWYGGQGTITFRRWVLMTSVAIPATVAIRLLLLRVIR